MPSAVVTTCGCRRRCGWRAGRTGRRPTAGRRVRAAPAGASSRLLSTVTVPGNLVLCELADQGLGGGPGTGDDDSGSGGGGGKLCRSGHVRALSDTAGGPDSGPVCAGRTQRSGRVFRTYFPAVAEFPRLFASVYPPVINTSGAASRPSRLLDSAAEWTRCGPARGFPVAVRAVALDADPVAALDHGFHQTAVRQG